MVDTQSEIDHIGEVEAALLDAELFVKYKSARPGRFAAPQGA